MTAIFPGSFDPVTLGHIDIIKRGALLFDQVIVAVLNNPAKSSLFTVAERVSMLQEIAEGIPGVQVEAYAGLLAEFAREKAARYVLRGVRTQADCAYEIPMAQANRCLGNKPETVILVANHAYGYISSGLIRQIAAAGYAAGFDDKVLDQWVPPIVKSMLKNKLKADIYDI